MSHLWLLFLFLLSPNRIQSQFTENWDSPNSDIFVTYATHGAASSGFDDPAATDSKALRLTLNARPPPGVGGAPAAETFARYQYGTYWTRAKTGNCSNQPQAGVVSGIFTYFNDGGDRNGNGIPVNSRIKFAQKFVKIICTLYQSITSPFSRTTPS